MFCEAALFLSDEEERSIDFQSFGNWYNSGGYGLVPWLELIDLSKWVAGVSYPHSDAEVSTLPPSDNTLTRSASACVVSLVGTGGVHRRFEMSPAAAAYIEQLSEGLSCSALNPEDLANVLLSVSCEESSDHRGSTNDGDGLLSQFAFMRAMRQVIASQSDANSTDENFNSLIVPLHALFCSLDRAERNGIDTYCMMYSFLH